MTTTVSAREKELRVKAVEEGTTFARIDVMPVPGSAAAQVKLNLARIRNDIHQQTGMAVEHLQDNMFLLEERPCDDKDESCGPHGRARGNKVGSFKGA